MRTKRFSWITAVAIIAAVGLAGATFAAPQQQEHHAQQVTTPEGTPDIPSLFHQMMTAMQEQMGNMQQMMSHMHSGQMPTASSGSHGGMGGMSGMMGGAGHMGGMMGNMTGTMAEMMGTMGDMMGTMGMMAMPDPASIDDPDVADQRAATLEAMAERMKARLDWVEAQAQALRKRAAELR